LRAEAAALLERQRQPVDNDILPRIRPQDVSPLPRPALVLPDEGSGMLPLTIAANGISYARVLYDVSSLEEEAWPWLQLYTDLTPELGIGDKTYEEADAWRHDRVPYFDIGLHGAQTQDEKRSLRMHLDFFAKGLREENRAVVELLSESIRAPRFDEHERLAFLIDSKVEDMRNDLADEGDDYARYSATAPLSPLRRFEDSAKGTASLTFYRELHAQSQSEEGIREIAQRLSELHQRIIGLPSTVIVAGTEQDCRELADMIALPAQPRQQQAPSTIDTIGEQTLLARVAVHAEAQVNHCFAAWRAPTCGHPDAPALSVLGEILTNLVLHQALREEGGAYGGHASYSATIGAFVMMSYRDPRLAATYQSFEQAIEWVQNAELKQENIEEAIICVIQSLDKPHSPFSEVMWSWDQGQQRITEDMRRQHRHGVLHCTAENLKAVAARWLQGKPCSRAAFVGHAEQDLTGLELVKLLELVE
jgi:Zn-dependent M16 (insulinase) family peptidase